MVVTNCGLNCIFLIINEVGHLFMFLVINVLFLRKVCSCLLFIFFISLIVLYMLGNLYIFLDQYNLIICIVNNFVNLQFVCEIFYNTILQVQILR